MLLPLMLYLGLINLFAFLMCGYDKWAACRRGWRRSEFSLLVPVVFGGGLGLYLAMKTFRHKTAKKSFLWKFHAAFVLFFLLTASVCYFAVNLPLNSN